ncbi:helix-turn-helix domain-containing protein [Streptomyces paludis]|uniref:XRE family transcriptional regulator n=1 Tax=Streptomyces paludis TaxID=2282738 RepID=A0A345I0W3_9ACTN|nr:helix-turn-helix transcriptional regulator [Streptomyces paludis]AXG82587.1 XRE family transcriptional regulator [Streptomyces paludis]
MSLQNQNPQPQPQSQQQSQQQSQTQTPIAWRYAGDQVKRWRMRAGISREELGLAAAYAPDTIKSMEQGVRMPTPKLLDAADDLFRAEGLLSAGKQYLRKERFPLRSQEIMDAEAEAVSMWSYEVALIPGLLQTETYARALFKDNCPVVSEDVEKERLRGRLERQKLLTRTPLVACSFVVYEAALHVPMGGRDAQKGQLKHLADMAQLRNVSLQVLPFKRAVSSALSGPIVVMWDAEHVCSGYVSGQSFSEFMSLPEQIGKLTERFGKLRTEALSVEESMSFITGMMEQL